MKLFQVPTSHIDKAWRDGAWNLSKACERTNEITGEQLKLLLSRGEFQLLGVLADRPIGWAAVRIDQLPNYRVLTINAIYSPGAIVFDQLKEYARFNGCSAIRGACDDAVSRLWKRLGAKKKYQIMEWEI